jgi:peptidyl-prolyl cis-trans isomerase C
MTRGRMLIGAVAVAALLVGIGPLGCSKGDKKAGGAEAPVTGDAKQEVATLGDQVIHLGEVNKIVESWRSGRIPGVDPGSPEAELQKRAVDQIINTKLLYAEAEKAKTIPTDQEVDSALQQMKQANGLDDSTFTSLLQQQHVTLDELKNNYRTDQAIRRFVKTEIQDTIKVSPEQARAYYESHPEEFKHAEQVHARHILIRVDSTATPQEVESARSRIEAIAKDLKNGADFAREAQAKSEDTESGSRGGDLGFFGRGQMVAPFDSVAFSLEPGQVSEPVRTPFGFHIIKVEEKRPEGTYAFNDVQGVLMQRMYGMRTSDRVNALLEELKSHAKIKRKI